MGGKKRVQSGAFRGKGGLHWGLSLILAQIPLTNLAICAILKAEKQHSEGIFRAG